MSDDVRREVETSLRAAADAVRDAQCALTSVAEGEHVVYGTRSKLCMALGLGTDASGITIVDAVRAVIRERDEARAEALAEASRRLRNIGARDPQRYTLAEAADVIDHQAESIAAGVVSGRAT